MYERQCQLWGDLVGFLENSRGRQFGTEKILVRLKSVETLNESMTVKETKRPFEKGSALAEKAEKIFLNHMEIMRLKYPVSLQSMKDNFTVENREFGLFFEVEKSVIILGAGIFLPHGENVQGDLEVCLVLKKQRQGSLSDPIAKIKDKIRHKDQFEHSAMCIEHEFGAKKRPEIKVCYDPPGHIRSQRKYKRRCFGIHPWPVMFKESVEILQGQTYFIGLRMHHCGRKNSDPVETVWGGTGCETVRIGIDNGFRFRKILDKPGQIRSSTTNGQIPLLYYI